MTEKILFTISLNFIDVSNVMNMSGIDYSILKINVVPVCFRL